MKEKEDLLAALSSIRSQPSSPRIAIVGGERGRVELQIRCNELERFLMKAENEIGILDDSVEELLEGKKAVAGTR